VEGKMKDFENVTVDNPGGETLRDTDVYAVTDNTFLDNLTISQTVLHPDKSTTGHSHDGLEEVYIFVSGIGVMELDDEEIVVGPNDMILIKEGIFHRVHNKLGNKDLVFTCIFQKYDRDE